MNFISKTTPNTKFAAIHTLLPEGTQMTLISLIKISVISVNQRPISGEGTHLPKFVYPQFHYTRPERRHL